MGGTWPALLLIPLLLFSATVAGRVLTKDEGAGPLYRGRDSPFYLAPLPGENVSQADGNLARGFLMVPNRSNGTGAVCARPGTNPPLTAIVACRALGWRGIARAAGAPAEPNATAIGDGGVAWDWVVCNGAEPGPLACNYKPVEANFTGCLPRARLVVECLQDPGQDGDVRFAPPPPAATVISDLYPRGLTVDVFNAGFWGYPGRAIGPTEAVVLCRERGITNGTAGVGNALAFGLGYRESGRAPALSFLRCNGTEDSLTACAYRFVPPFPYRNYFDYLPRGSLSYFGGPYLPLLYCEDALNDTELADTGPYEELSLRLVPQADAPDPPSDASCTAGEPQIRVEGYWGRVAIGTNGSSAEEQDVADANAQVICRELGLPTGNATTQVYAAKPEVRLPVWLYDLECSGEEESVQECYFQSNVLPGGGPQTRLNQFFSMQVSCC